MKQATSFDRDAELIIVKGIVWGPLGTLPLRLVVDTGATETFLPPEVIDDLGYSLRDGDKITSVYSAIGEEHGYIRRVSRFAALGFEVEAFRIHVFDLPDRYDIDGLLGLSFLRRFNYEVRSDEGLILASPIAT